jgi:stage II sporulation protein M
MSYRRWVFIASSLLVIGLVVGLTTPVDNELFSEYIAPFEGLGSILAPFSFLTAIFIFLKNTSALLLSFVFSPILCLSPILSLTINGWFIGLVSVEVVQKESIGFLLAGLLPHGVFEIPALILGQAAALSFGMMVMLALLKKEKRSLILPALKQNLRYLAIAVILLLPAAIIETYVTPLLIT